MKINEGIKLDFSDVLIEPKTSTMESRAEVQLERDFQLKHAGWKWSGIPIIAANMDTTGTIKMAKAFEKYDMAVALHKHYEISELVNVFNDEYVNAFYSMGIGQKDFEKFYQFVEKNKAYPRMVCVDVANGYTEKFLKAISVLRSHMPETFIMAGNCVSPSRTEQIILAGADCVKIGIGSGAVCTTRIKTGVGYPQLSAIIESADAAHGLGGLVCADGGCTNPGDIAKAFGGGADFVMIGGMLAGTDESGGERVYHHEESSTPSHVRFYGMSSKKANDEYAGGLNDYRSAEGKEVLVPYKGPVDLIIKDILGGLRSTLTYTGSVKLKELSKRTTFIRVNNQYNRIFD